MKDPEKEWNIPPSPVSTRQLLEAQYTLPLYPVFRRIPRTYDLSKDPHEWKNLAADLKNKRILEEHEAHLPKKEHPILPGGSTAQRLRSSQRQHQKD